MQLTTFFWALHLAKYIETIGNVKRTATRKYPDKFQLPTPEYKRLRGDMIETFKILEG